MTQDCIDIISGEDVFTRSDYGRYTVLQSGFKEYLIDHRPPLFLQYMDDMDFPNGYVLGLCGIDSIRDTQNQLIPVKEKFISMLQDGTIAFEMYNEEASPSFGFLIGPHASITEVKDIIVSEKREGPNLVLFFSTESESTGKPFIRYLVAFEFSPALEEPGGYKFVCCRFRNVEI